MIKFNQDDFQHQCIFLSPCTVLDILFHTNIFAKPLGKVSFYKLYAKALVNSFTNSINWLISFSKTDQALNKYAFNKNVYKCNVGMCKCVHETSMQKNINVIIIMTKNSRHQSEKFGDKTLLMTANFQACFKCTFIIWFP